MIAILLAPLHLFKIGTNRTQEAATVNANTMVQLVSWIIKVENLNIVILRRTMTSNFQTTKMTATVKEHCPNGSLHTENCSIFMSGSRVNSMMNAQKTIFVSTTCGHMMDRQNPELAVGTKQSAKITEPGPFSRITKSNSSVTKIRRKLLKI